MAEGDGGDRGRETSTSKFEKAIGREKCGGMERWYEDVMRASLFLRTTVPIAYPVTGWSYLRIHPLNCCLQTCGNELRVTDHHSHTHSKKKNYSVRDI